MGAGVSNWRLARAVSMLGQIGVVAGTGLDQIMTRRLQDGDRDGLIRRALSHFPFPALARRILDLYYLADGRAPGQPYKAVRMHDARGHLPSQGLCVAANFVEVFLAREGHAGLVGINFLEKIQFPHLPSLYGALLAGVAVVIVGAGIPFEFPAAIAALARHQPATYTLAVSGAGGQAPVRLSFDPAALLEPGQAALAALASPAFLPIVSSDALATLLDRRLGDAVTGFIVENAAAGGHNAPPRGALRLASDGQPLYGPRDQADLAVFRRLDRPFWLAGSYGTPERLAEALAQGATGVQVGTPFALCEESGLTPEIRRELVRMALAGDARIFTDPRASPTGFPFKVAELAGTLSDAALYQARRRFCDLGFLREAYRKADGTLGYRCAAEVQSAYADKDGAPEDTAGRKCLCNALVANIGMPQPLPDGTFERPLITLGDDFTAVGRFCAAGQPDFSAADVVRCLLG